MNTLTLIDYLSIAYLAYHALKGFRKGFISIILETITLVIIIALILTYYPQLSAILLTYFPIPLLYRNIISISLIGGSVLLISWIANKVLTYTINTTGLGTINHIMGLGVGVIKGTAILMIMIIPLYWVSPSLVKQSVLLKKLHHTIQTHSQALNQSSTIEK